MNKYRRAESRQVKRIVRLEEALGRHVNYRAVRRKLRAYKRLFASAPKTTHDTVRRLVYSCNEAVLSIRAIRESLDLANETLRTSAISDKLSMYRR